MKKVFRFKETTWKTFTPEVEKPRMYPEALSPSCQAEETAPPPVPSSDVPLRKRDQDRLARGEIEFRCMQGPFFGDGAKPTDPRQGTIGDCYVLSAFSAVAWSAPHLLESMLRSHDDGTWSLTVYRRMGQGQFALESVRVDGKVPVNVADGTPIYARTLPGAEGLCKIWPLLAEKGYARWKGGYDAIGEGGAVEDVLEELTGQPSRLFYVAEHQPELLWEILSRADREKWPTAVCTYSRRERPGIDELGFHPSHILVFLGVHTLRGRRIVCLRDPFDKPMCGTLCLPDLHGVFTVLWENFLSYFAEVLVNSEHVHSIASPPYPSLSVRQTLDRSYVFRPLDVATKRELTRDFQRECVPVGTRVISVDSPGDYYYLIQSGRVSVEVGPPGSPSRRRVAVLSAGDQFGEGALIFDRPRSADIVAMTELVLYRMAARKFHEWIERLPELLPRFRRRFELRVWMNQWSDRPVSSMPLDTLLEASRDEHYPPGSLIIRQGDVADCFYVNLEGQVEVFIQADGSERRVKVLEEGEIFGEVTAMKRLARMSSVRALTESKLLRLDITAVASIMDNFEVVQRQWEFIARSRDRRLRGRKKTARPQAMEASQVESYEGSWSI